MDLIFDNLSHKREKLISVRDIRSSSFSRSMSPVPQNKPEDQGSVNKEQRTFLHLISDRITKKMFMAKQKQRFLQKAVMNKKGKVIYEGEHVDNLVSLDRKIELFQDVLRHIREK